VTYSTLGSTSFPLSRRERGTGVRTYPVIHPSWLSFYEVTLDLDDDRSELRHAAAHFGPDDPEPTVRRCDHAEIVTEPVAGSGRQRGPTAGSVAADHTGP